ncbi:plasmid replication protein RepC [Litoreibacter arenae]|uniref:Plasmid replication protein RepC n=1 Tax=Litoreibacter arenae DSM 19593 TaxID=1123360 RepID=S9QEC2_9RHOB|nr:plasmid replication protein RepC [Litoreibacter arenae]EPX78282.1 Plasmid replication protein RepC [Litoreibacter arenae DSM 19593]
MRKFRETPIGDTRAGSDGTGYLRPDGWRNASQALLASAELAKKGASRAIPKTRAVVAVKRVGAHIGLKAADLLLLDTLAAFTQPQDWEEGRRPIVWASNAFLMEQTGFSLSTLKRHGRRLVEVGIITFNDSPNGKRWGRRDAAGVIVEAYGFDLSPLSARAEEFEELATELSAERSLCQRLKRQITIARRSIRARLEAAWQDDPQSRGLTRIQQAYDALLEKLPRSRMPSDLLEAVLERFRRLLARIEGALLTPDTEEATQLCESHETPNLTPKEAKSDPHIQTTNQLYLVTCNSAEEEDEATAPPGTATATRDLDLPMILQACPEFTSWGHDLGKGIGGWPDFMRCAEALRPMIGISDQSWAQAQVRMGRPVAAAALALVFEKVQAGEVASAGGYLLGMARKFEIGELHLDRSFFGRLKGLAA